MEKQFLVALHAQSHKQVFAEAEKILTPKGAHGLIVVNNGYKVLSSDDVYPNLFDITIELKQAYPDYIIGINPLDLETVRQSLQRTYLVQKNRTEQERVFDLLWTDGNGIEEIDGQAVLSSAVEEILSNKLFTSADGIRYYGSIGFKYQPQSTNLEAVAKCASRNFAAVVTSGDGTGIAARIEKIRCIKELIGSTPLVLASGITVGNVDQYFPYVDIFIVGTSLLESPDNQFIYSQEKVEQFRSVIDTL